MPFKQSGKMMKIFILFLSFCFYFSEVHSAISTSGENVIGNKSLAKLIVEMEKSILRDYMSPRWKNKVESWRGELLKPGVTLDDLKKSLFELDKHIMMAAFNVSYRRQVSDWTLQLSVAAKTGDIARVVFNIEGNLLKKAREAWWKNRSAAWINECRNLF